MSLPVHPRDELCIGCLGSGQCWVCLGQGRLERANGSYEGCDRCGGSGRCALCDQAVRNSLPAKPPEGPTVLHLDAPAAATMLSSPLLP